jgi:hypothetical protein
MASSNGRQLRDKKASKPYAIAMMDGGLLGIGGFWEN